MKPTIVFDFQSNRDYKFSVKSFHICPWVSQIPDSFNFELITFNTGDILSHWRLQIENKNNLRKSKESRGSQHLYNATNSNDVSQNVLRLSSSATEHSSADSTHSDIEGARSARSTDKKAARSETDDTQPQSQNAYHIDLPQLLGVTHFLGVNFHI